MSSSSTESKPRCRCSARWYAKRRSSTATTTSTGSKSSSPRAAWGLDRLSAGFAQRSQITDRFCKQKSRLWHAAQLNLILEYQLFVITDQDVEAEPPAPADGDAHIFDPPIGVAVKRSVAPHRLDAGGGIGERQRQLLGSERAQLRGEQQHADAGAARAHRRDLELRQGALAMDVDGGRLGHGKGARRRGEAPKPDQRQDPERERELRPDRSDEGARRRRTLRGEPRREDEAVHRRQRQQQRYRAKLEREHDAVTRRPECIDAIELDHRH